MKRFTVMKNENTGCTNSYNKVILIISSDLSTADMNM